MLLLLASVVLASNCGPGTATSSLRESIHAAGFERNSSASSALLDTQSTESLRRARQHAATGEVDHARATLDSLVMAKGVSVAIEAPSDMMLWAARGVETWNDALGERAFRIERAETADVTVRFVHELDKSGCGTQGRVEATRQTSWSGHTHVYRLNGTIYVRDNVAGRPVQPDEIVNVIAHECGHILGLADTNRTDRLMGPLVPGHTKDAPTAAETRAIQEYRDQVRQSYPKE